MALVQTSLSGGRVAGGGQVAFTLVGTGAAQSDAPALGENITVYTGDAGQPSTPSTENMTTLLCVESGAVRGVLEEIEGSGRAEIGRLGRSCESDTGKKAGRTRTLPPSKASRAPLRPPRMPPRRRSPSPPTPRTPRTPRGRSTRKRAVRYSPARLLDLLAWTLTRRRKPEKKILGSRRIVLDKNRLVG